MDVDTLTEGALARHRRAARAVVVGVVAFFLTGAWLVTAAVIAVGAIPLPPPVPRPDVVTVSVITMLGPVAAGFAGLVAVDQDQQGTWLRKAGVALTGSAVASVLFAVLTVPPFAAFVDWLNTPGGLSFVGA